MYVYFNIPEIDSRNGDFLNFWLKTIFISPVSSNFQVNALSVMYVRLVEAAFVEYSLGRQSLMEFWSTHTGIALGAMHRSVSHFESCLSNTHRAKQAFSRLRNHADNGELRKLLSNPRPNFIQAKFADQIRAIRNEIHHTEDSLMKGLLGSGNPVMLKADGPETVHPTEANQTNKLIDRLVVGQQELLFSELATALTEMADYCKKISENISSSSPGNAA
ncbi:hypothetical protein [Lysobacter hankyongensis]|uniref:RiboL-PSP-HEPN domain-containing protein n=1 Tax=Lysobacter hankyongensis TaxID=1176535 RepID=A0ABP9BKF9_9GAMM